MKSLRQRKILSQMCSGCIPIAYGILLVMTSAIIKKAKTKMRRLEEKGGEREQVRLQKQALRQDLLRQTEIEGAWEERLQKQALRLMIPQNGLTRTNQIPDAAH